MKVYIVSYDENPHDCIEVEKVFLHKEDAINYAITNHIRGRKTLPEEKKRIFAENDMDEWEVE